MRIGGDEPAGWIVGVQPTWCSVVHADGGDCRAVAQSIADAQHGTVNFVPHVPQGGLEAGSARERMLDESSTGNGPNGAALHLHWRLENGLTPTRGPRASWGYKKYRLSHELKAWPGSGQGP
jgi:hypothetical protein